VLIIMDPLFSLVGAKKKDVRDLKIRIYSVHVWKRMVRVIMSDFPEISVYALQAENDLENAIIDLMPVRQLCAAS
jgi:hypothetical protein